MANLYLTEQGSVLRKTGDRLIVQKDDEILLDIQCHKIDAVLIFGNVQFTTQAVHELFEHGIEMALLTRTGRIIGQLTSPTPKNIDLRLAQYEKFKDERFKINISKCIVTGKIRNALEFTRRFIYNHPESNLQAELHGLEKIYKNVDSTNNIAEILGKEGAAANIYFKGFGKMMLKGFDFTGRRKRPASDPVNALLSFGYTLVFNEIASLLDGIGFDPFIGFFHTTDYGRQSLAADILEEFRTPIIDRLTLKLINNRIFTKDDFYLHTSSGSMYLKKESMKIYFREYERFLTQEFTHPETGNMTDFRRYFRYQAHRMADCLTDSGDYKPFFMGR